MTERNRLIQDACDSLIQGHDFGDAWIALVGASGELEAAASAGTGSDFPALFDRLARGESVDCMSLALATEGVQILTGPVPSCADCPLSKEHADRTRLAVRLRDGGAVYGLLMVTASPQWAPGTEFSAFLEGTASDIARTLYRFEADKIRRQAEEALRKSEARMESIFRAAPVGIGVSSNRILMDVNNWICEITGYSREELIGESSRMLYPSDADYEYVGSEKYRQIRQVGTGSVETRFQRKDGQIIDVLLSSAPLDPTDLSAGVTFTVLDITERKRAERALRRSLEETSRSQRLLTVISQATGAVLRARTPETVYQAISKQVAMLGLDATVLLLNKARTHLIVSHLTLESDLVRAAEKLTGLSAQGYSVPLIQGGFFQEIMDSGETTYRPLDAELFSGALPHPLHPVAEGLLKLLGWQQGIFAALVIGGEASGLLAITGVGLTETDVPAITAFANQAAIAIENARLHTSVQARAAELEMLYELGLNLISTLDTDVVIETALSQLQHLFQAESALLIQHESPSGELHLRKAFVGSTLLEPSLPLPPGQGISGWVSEHRQSLWIADTRDDPTFSGRVDRHLGIRTRSLLAAPFLMAGRILGQIVVTSNQVGAYTSDDLRILEAVTFALSIALENARLYEEQKALLLEHEQAQIQLIQSEKLAALGRLTASLAHEINNPLQALRSGLGLLRKGTLEKGKQQQYLQIASREVERMIAITERMLNFYRPSIEQRKLTNINDVLDEVLTLAGKKLQHSRVVLSYHLDAHLPAIEVVADQVRQVFLNIVLNALDAMPEGGELYVASGFDRQGQDVWISFADTGRGIPAEDVPRIFEPFYSTRSDGTGLGLAISYGIVERHQGRIDVASELDKGSTFTVFFPVGADS